jgi:dTDP-4-dehydrorhamnose 3,5-epimerase
VNSGNFTVSRTQLGLGLVAARVYNDERGFFYESWSEEALRALGLEGRFVQDNHSSSRRGVIRGLHWQRPPFAQAKLIRCTRGRIHGCVVDIRGGSPTFGTAEYYELVGAAPGDPAQSMLFVPAGFAHGFQALDDVVEVEYKVTAPWNAKAEGCIAFDDPDLDLGWIDGDPPLVSAKDRAGMSFAAYRERPDFLWEGRP